MIESDKRPVRPDTTPTPAALPAALTLDVPERLLLLAMLPQQGTRSAMVLADSIERLLGFDAAEQARYGIRQVGDQVHYELAANEAVQIEFSQGQRAFLQDCAAQADQEGRVTRPMLPLLTKLDTLVNVTQ